MKPKLCVDCKHYIPAIIDTKLWWGLSESKCKAMVELEFGQPLYINRVDGDCGKEGKLWEPK